MTVLTTLVSLRPMCGSGIAGSQGRRVFKSTRISHILLQSGCDISPLTATWESSSFSSCVSALGGVFPILASLWLRDGTAALFICNSATICTQVTLWPFRSPVMTPAILPSCQKGPVTRHHLLWATVAMLWPPPTSFP
jgi:hypothetical protein